MIMQPLNAHFSCVSTEMSCNSNSTIFYRSSHLKRRVQQETNITSSMIGTKTPQMSVFASRMTIKTSMENTIISS